jgi:hypothetical protein
MRGGKRKPQDIHPTIRTSYDKQQANELSINEKIQRRIKAMVSSLFEAPS